MPCLVLRNPRVSKIMASGGRLGKAEANGNEHGARPVESCSVGLPIPPIERRLMPHIMEPRRNG